MPQLDLGSVLGPRGAQGPTGPQGEQGSPGKNATINGVNALTLETGDGLEAEMSGGVYRLKMAGGSDMAAHIARTDNPHGVTAGQIGAAPSSHSHPVGDITGVLPVSKGGTGQTSLAALMSAMGAGKIVTGYYSGDRNASMTINLGFTPKAVIVCQINGYMVSSGTVFGGIAVTGSNARSYDSNPKPIISITNNGFTVYYSYGSGGTNVCTNQDTAKYNYIAFG